MNKTISVGKTHERSLSISCQVTWISESWQDVSVSVRNTLVPAKFHSSIFCREEPAAAAANATSVATLQLDYPGSPE